jgi:murein DD-endopeptidase MepM/ murein hydrolase activator NlpD
MLSRWYAWPLTGCLALKLLAAHAAAFAPEDLAVQIRFYPGRNLRVYEVDARHGLSGALLQNAAIVNRTDFPVTFERAEIELISGGSVIQVHRLSQRDLDRGVQRGLMLQKAGLLEKFAFQFRPDVLLGKEITLADSLQVPAKAAILLGQRYFVFSGAAEQLRMRAYGRRGDGAPVQVEASLPILMKGSQVEYDFPLAGRWFVAVGQGLQNPHRWVVPEEFAFDLVKLGNNASTHQGNGAKRSDFYAYGETVLAAADGTVRAGQDSIAETDSNLQQPDESSKIYQTRVLAMQDELLAKGALQAAGNYIVLEHNAGEYSFYAHLMPGSLQVHTGQPVKRGQPIARLGHSGNSTEPHLHFHVIDGPDPLLSAGIPIRFRNVTLPLAGEDRALHDGDVVDAH